MFTKHFSAVLILVTFFAVLPVSGAVLKSVTATANYQGYTLTALVEDLAVGTTCTVEYNLSMSRPSKSGLIYAGWPVDVPGTITLEAKANTMTVAASGTFPELAMHQLSVPSQSSFEVTGTANLKGESPIVTIIINGGAVAALKNIPITATCVGIFVVRGVPIKPRVPLIPQGGEGPPYTLLATGLPTGLSMAADGTLSGIPTVTGNVSYAVTIRDPVGNKGTVNMDQCGTWEDLSGPNVTIKPGKLIHKVQPEYPVAAKLMQIRGTVVLRVTISKDGTVGDLETISGPKELIPSAIEAVKHWRWQPYSINNDPIAVETFIQVVF